MPKNSSIRSAVSTEHRLVTDGQTDTGPRGFCQTNYLNIFHEIYMIGRTSAADERHEVIFFYLLRKVAVATNFVGKIDLHSNLVVRMTFARAAPPAYEKRAIAMQGAGKQIT